MISPIAANDTIRPKTTMNTIILCEGSCGIFPVVPNVLELPANIAVYKNYEVSEIAVCTRKKAARYD